MQTKLKAQRTAWTSRALVVTVLFIANLALVRPQAAVAEASYLASGAVLGSGGKLLSPDGHYTLLMQTDGNLVDYSWPRPLWAANTNKAGSVLRMQSDGNLVIVAPGNVPVWASNTAGNPGAYLVIQNDANMVVVSSDGRALWASGAVDYKLEPGQRLNPNWTIQSPDRRYRMVMQSDGNLVEYGPNGPMWASGTYVANSTLEMQSDGNLVVYAPGHVPVWSSNTGGRSGSVLFGQNDGNFVLYAPGNVAVWSTGTANSGSSTAQVAKDILNKPSRIALATVHASGVRDNANALQNMKDTADGKQAARSCYQNAPCGSVWLRLTMLKALSGLGDRMTIRVSEIAGGSHKIGSYHYLGIAFDIDIIGGKYVTSSTIAKPAVDYCYSMEAKYSLFENGNHVHCEWNTSVQ